MPSASEVMSGTRNRVAYLVEREQRNTGSRMVAYENVAAQLGKSSVWVRRIVKGYADAAPDFVTGLNIVALYDRICSRVEANEAAELARSARAKDEFYAANPGIDRLVQGVAGTPTLGTKAEGEAG
jgi:hypothetical protein